MALEVNDVNFDEVVLHSDKPVMVDFWAEWCGPCRIISPALEEISKEYSDKAVVAKCDVDTSPAVVAKFGIRNIPTVLYFKDGKVADKQVGAVPKANFVNKLKNLLQYRISPHLLFSDDSMCLCFLKQPYR
jgi:thioredoxin